MISEFSSFPDKDPFEDDYMGEPDDIIIKNSKKIIKLDSRTSDVIKKMDEATVLAETEFKESFVNWKAHDVILWWSKWYLKAGHKRLGRILIKEFKKK